MQASACGPKRQKRACCRLCDITKPSFHTSACSPEYACNNRELQSIMISHGHKAENLYMRINLAPRHTTHPEYLSLSGFNGVQNI
eukprot:scaffold111714_cov14-Tisochrysis_lutea.AAC.1